MSNRKVKKMCFLALFTAASLVLSWVETLIPINLGVPGIKLGLANILTLTILVTYGFKESFGVMFLRVILMGLMFTGLVMMLYSFAGGLLSILVMWLLYKTKLFNTFVISIFGGIFHNIGQLIVAIMMMNSTSLIAYFPVLVLSGTLAGICVGLLSLVVCRYFRQYLTITHQI